MSRYNPKAIEKHWQNIWDENNVFKAVKDKSKPIQWATLLLDTN